MCHLGMNYGNSLGANAKQQRFMEEKSWETRVIRAKTRHDSLHSKIVGMEDAGYLDTQEMLELMDDRELWKKELERLDQEGLSRGWPPPPPPPAPHPQPSK